MEIKTPFFDHVCDVAIIAFDILFGTVKTLVTGLWKFTKWIFSSELVLSTRCRRDPVTRQLTRVMEFDCRFGSAVLTDVSLDRGQRPIQHQRVLHIGCGTRYELELNDGQYQTLNFTMGGQAYEVVLPPAGSTFQGRLTIRAVVAPEPQTAADAQAAPKATTESDKHTAEYMAMLDALGTDGTAH